MNLNEILILSELIKQIICTIIGIFINLSTDYEFDATFNVSITLINFVDSMTHSSSNNAELILHQISKHILSFNIFNIFTIIYYSSNVSKF